MTDTISSESGLMRFFRALGMEPIAWSLRRLHCPVSPDALVLEVGSGGNPYYRANVLLDAYEETRERHWVPLKADRPTVLGFAENLPFRNHAFDFVIASHVLEHSPNPEKFLSEIQRVGRAGYIEVPDAFMERINPYRDHRLEITSREGKLVIRKKASWKVEPETVELYEHKVKAFMTREWMRSRPFAFHLRYYWQNTIEFTVLNPEADATWEPVTLENSGPGKGGGMSRLKGAVLNLARAVLSQSARNKKLDLSSLLRCPSCFSDPLIMAKDSIQCESCGIRYPVKNGIPLLNSTLSNLKRQKNDRG